MFPQGVEMSGSDWRQQHSQNSGVWLSQGCCRRANQHRNLPGGRSHLATTSPSKNCSQAELDGWGLALCSSLNWCVEQKASFDQQ